MNRMSIIVSCALAAPLSAQTIGIDFGDQNNLTPGNYNNVDHIQNPLFNLVDTTGAGTGISLTVSDSFWPGSNQNGTGTPGGAAGSIPTQATADNLFGSTVAFGGFLEPTGGVTLAGLDASGATAYNFLFFGSRMGVTDNRETSYSLSGASSATTLLDTANNTDNVATIAGMHADANGEISLTVTAGPNNTNGSGFYYIGYMQITVVPAPGAAGALALASLVATRRRR